MDSLVESLRTHALPKEPPFPAAEYDARLAAVRGAMEARGLDLLVVGNPGNICWLTGFESAMPSSPATLVVGGSGELGIVCPDLELPCVELFTTLTDVAVDGWHTGRDVASLIADQINARVASGARIGIELAKIDTYSVPSFDAATVEAIRGAVAGAEWVDTTLLIPELRLIKSDAELAAMRTAGEYTAAGMDAAIEAIAAGATDNDVAAAAYFGTIGAGSEEMPIDPQLAVGKRSGFMPFLPHRRIPLEAGDSVYIEISGIHRRYSAPLMRTAALGEPSDAVRRQAEFALATVEALLGEVRPGRTGADIEASVSAAVGPAPEETFFPGTYGYSCGLGIQPTWTEYPGYLAEGSDFELRERMTVHLPICLWSPRDRAGVGFSETLEVTGDGCALLTPGRGRELVIR
jgi:Xaa-Pro dipeptidase